MASKRTTTETGMGAVRKSRAPAAARRSLRAPPVECPAPRVPQVEEVLTKRVQSTRKRTLARSGSSGDILAVDAKRETGVRINGTVTPRHTAAARDLAGSGIAPRDAFLLSRIDGELNAADLADLTGIPEREVLAMLQNLARFGLVLLRMPAP